MKINGEKESINVIDALKLEHSQSHPPIPLIHLAISGIASIQRHQHH